MNLKRFTWGILICLAVVPSTASAQWWFSTLPCGHLPIPAAPDTYGPGFYVANCAGMVYGPNYYLHPCYLPHQGAIFNKPLKPACHEKEQGPDPRQFMAPPMHYGAPAGLAMGGPNYAAPPMANPANQPGLAAAQQTWTNPYQGPYGNGNQKKEGIPTFPIHPCVRSPRDYFMIGEDR